MPSSLAAVKAIVVKQPWAAEIAQGVKTIEVRGWRTSHRGDLLIVSQGVAQCLVRVAEVRPFVRADKRAAGCDWEPGLWSWVLVDVRSCPPWRKIRGMPGLFEFQPARALDLLPVPEVCFGCMIADHCTFGLDTPPVRKCASKMRR